MINLFENVILQPQRRIIIWILFSRCALIVEMILAKQITLSNKWKNNVIQFWQMLVRTKVSDYNKLSASLIIEQEQSLSISLTVIATDFYSKK